MNPSLEMSMATLAPSPISPGLNSRLSDRAADGGLSIDKQALRQSAEEFEAVFISQMLQHMFSGVETDPLFGGGPAEGMYRSLMVENYGDEIAKGGGIGIADTVYRDLLRAQEGNL